MLPCPSSTSNQQDRKAIGRIIPYGALLMLWKFNVLLHAFELKHLNGQHHKLILKMYLLRGFIVMEEDFNPVFDILNESEAFTPLQDAETSNNSGENFPSERRGLLNEDDINRPPIITFDLTDGSFIEEGEISTDSYEDFTELTKRVKENPELGSKLDLISRKVVETYEDDPLTGQRGNQNVIDFVERNLPLFQDALGLYFNNIPFVSDNRPLA